MNGATELPPPNTTKNPISIKIMITGASQNLRRSFIKSQKSFKNSIVLFYNSSGIRHLETLNPF